MLFPGSNPSRPGTTASRDAGDPIRTRSGGALASGAPPARGARQGQGACACPWACACSGTWRGRTWR